MWWSTNTIFGLEIHKPILLLTHSLLIQMILADTVYTAIFRTIRLFSQYERLLFSNVKPF